MSCSFMNNERKFDQITIMPMSRQLSCPDKGKIVTWLDH